MLEYLYYVLLVIALAIFAKGMKEKIDFINSGQPSAEPRLNNLTRRLKCLIKDGFIFIRLYIRERKMGVGHFLVLWGFIILSINILIFTVYMLAPDAFRSIYLIFKYSMTASAILFFLGLLIMVTNRYLIRPSRFAKKYEKAKDDDLVLLILFFAALFGIVLKEFVRFAPLNSTLSPVLWLLHTVLILAFVALIPYTKLLHILMAPLSILTRSERPPGVMRPAPESEEYMGLITNKDLTRRDILSSLACMRCGRCQDNCPAFNSGTSLSPMYLIQNIRMLEKIIKGQKTGETATDGGEEEVLLLDTVLDMDAIWACTTCRVCMEMCPVYIEQMEIIGEIRRGVIESGEAPPDIRDFLTNIQKQKNPWGEAKFKRDQWIKKSEIPVPSVKENPEFEWLWFVGCAHSFDNRNIQVSKKIAEILNDLEINYAVLGREEGCCGNDVRRVGEEGLFQLLKEENERIFEKYGVKKIITTSPHCYNTFKNEYEGYEVKFILEIIYEAIKSGKLKLKKPINKKVTYHDPCYLGRYNGMYELPREILKAIPGLELVEMPRNRNRSFCCGAGGGNLIREYPGEDRPNNIRAREAAETGAEILAVACPFCMIMLEDGVKTEKLDDRVEVKDILELVYESAYSEE